MEEVTMYKTIDGIVYHTQEEAKKHEEFLLFEEAYEMNSGNIIHAEEIYDFLIKNSDLAISTLKKIGKL